MSVLGCEQSETPDMKRVASFVLLGACVFFATRLFAPAEPRRAPAQQPATRPAPTTTSDDRDLAAQVDRLRERLTNPPALPPSSRNPFEFGAPARVAEAAGAPPAPSVAAPPQPVAAREPDLPKLVAIATDVVNGASVRTACLSLDDGVALVRGGESIGPFVVRTIEADGVDLVFAPSGAVYRLKLHQ
jgi:hypothetical protein